MPPSSHHQPSQREENANALSHALGCALALAATPVLGASVDAGLHPLRWVGVQVFVASMVLMLGVSAFYHAATPGPAKRWLRRCDHAAIYVFMAGSYTPFALAQAQRGGGHGLLLGVWAIALAGVVLKLADRLRRPLPSTLLYLAFGWMVLLVARPMVDALPRDGRVLLFAGGVAYTAGSLFFLAGLRRRWCHLLWHLFVVAGCALHFLAVQQTVA